MWTTGAAGAEADGNSMNPGWAGIASDQEYGRFRTFIMRTETLQTWFVWRLLPICADNPVRNSETELSSNRL